MKVMTTPVICIIQYLLYRIVVPFNELLALIPVGIGVSLATVTTLYSTFWGLLFGSLGILSTSIYQIFVKSKQGELSLDSWQLLHKQAPISFVMLTCSLPFIEP